MTLSEVYENIKTLENIETISDDSSHMSNDVSSDEELSIAESLYEEVKSNNGADINQNILMKMLAQNEVLIPELGKCKEFKVMPDVDVLFS